jgi:2-polyprenyl-3-methyl-5-hydroxy-6-metoxy-1,4-benzoquinol methylase
MLVRNKYDKSYFDSTIFRLPFLTSDKRKISLIKEYLVGKSILELGCGTGEILAGMPQNYSKLGVDIAQAGVDEAKRRFPDLDFRVMDIEKEVIKAQFDTVIALDVFEHLSDPERMLKQTAKLTNKKGKLIMSVPNNYGISGLVTVPLMNKLDTTHVSTYRREKWEVLLKNTGWRTTSIYNKVGPYYLSDAVSKYFATSVLFVAEKN